MRDDERDEMRCMYSARSKMRNETEAKVFFVRCKVPLLCFALLSLVVLRARARPPPKPRGGQRVCPSLSLLVLNAAIRSCICSVIPREPQTPGPLSVSLSSFRLALVSFFYPPPSRFLPVVLGVGAGRALTKIKGFTFGGQTNRAPPRVRVSPSYAQQRSYKHAI